MISSPACWGGGPPAGWWRGRVEALYPSTMLRTVPLPGACRGGNSIAPDQALDERGPEGRLDARQAEAACGPLVAGVEGIGLAVALVKGVPRSIAGMIDPDRPARSVE